MGLASYSAPDALFSVSVQGVQAWRVHDLVAVEGATSLIGLLLGSTIAAGYLSVYTPRRRLIRGVRRGLARDEFFVFYPPIVDVPTGAMGWGRGAGALAASAVGPGNARAVHRPCGE